MTTGLTYLCRWTDLPDGGSRGFDPWQQGRDTVFLVRRQDQVWGYLDACPHQDGAVMAWRKDAYLSGDGHHIVCHAHGARFDIATGRCVLGPCLGQALRPVKLVLDPQGACYMASTAYTETTS